MKLLLLILTIIFMFVAPATASAAPTASIRADQGDTFTATANGTNLQKIDIYRTPTGYASWTFVGTGSCSGSTCSYSVSWDPSSTGTRDWYFVVNAFDSTGQCTGNPFPFGPSWSDCGTNDYTGMTPPTATSPSASCPIPGTTADLSWSASGGTSYAVYAQNAANPFVWGAAACQSPNLCWNPPYTSPSASTSFSTTPGVSYNWYVFNCNGWGCSAPASYSTTFTCAYPNCNTNLDCVLCGAPANTCSTNNGTQTCYYRAYTGGGTCNVVSFNQSCTIDKCDSPLGYSCNSNRVCVPPPPTASITGSSSGIIGQSLSFTATANGTNLNRIGIYRSPKDIQSWTEIASGSCSGSTCSLTGSWTPTAGDAKDWYVVANAYDVYSQQCTGNPWTSFPNPTWTDCGSSDNITTTVKLPAPTNPAGSCPIPGTTANFSWTGSAGAGSYTVYAFNTAGTQWNSANPWDNMRCGSGGLDVCDRVTGTSDSPTSLTPGANYQWYVFACVGDTNNCSDPASYSTTFTCLYNNAQYVSQSCPSSNMTTGQTNNVSVVMNNSGNTTWPASSTYRLGSQNPQDNTTWGFGRIIPGSSIPPGSNYAIGFTVTAPSSPGTYNFQWRMVQEAVEWFGGTTPNCSVNVAYPAAPTASITGSSSGIIGQSLSFTATANGTNLNRIGIYRSPKDIQSWTEIASGSCSGSTCSLTGSWTPTAGDAKDWYVVANAYDVYSQQCTGNPWTSFPNPTWTDCGSSDNITTTVKLPAPTNPAGSCPIPGTTANFSWTGSAGAGSYTVYAFNTAGTQWNSANPWDNMRCGSGGLDVCARVTGTSYSAPSLMTPGANYQWFVFACVGDTNNCSDPASYSTTFTCIPAPISPTPTVTPNLSCTPVDTGINSNMYTISWTNNPSTPVTYVDISTDNFATFYNKAVSGASTSASSGFTLWQGVGQPSGPSLTLQPDTPYSVRTYNGYNNSGTTTFTTPSRCPPPTASITGPLTALIDQSLTYSAQIFNAGSGTVFVTRSDNNTFTCPPGIFTDSTGRNWCIIETFTNGNYNGSTFSAAFTPRESGIYRVIVNAYANTTAEFTADKNTECTGNPFGLNPTQQAQWSDCGPNDNDNVTTNVDRTPAPPPTTNCGGGVSPRAEGLVTTPTLQTGSKFGTSPTGRCVAGNESTTLNEVAFASFKIPTYDDLKSIYYTQSKATKIQSSSQNLNPTTSEDDRKVFNYTAADVSVNSAAPYAGTAVIFIDGNLNIDKDITTSDRTKGLVLVIKNNVNIDVGVKQIDAVIMSAGKIYTAGAGCATNNVETANALIVNGSLISLDPGAIVFCRTLINNSQAAERIYQQPKYLVILRDLFADTLQKWSEIP